MKRPTIARPIPRQQASDPAQWTADALEYHAPQPARRCRPARRVGRATVDVILSITAVAIATAVGHCGDAHSASDTDIHIAIRVLHDQPVVVVTGLPADLLDRLRAPQGTDLAKTIFQLYVAGDKQHPAEDQPAMLGRYRVDDNTLVFQPRFPLRPNLAYEARLRRAPKSSAPPGGSVPELLRRLVLPQEDLPPSRVTAVYPSDSVLPENLLKFYVHFSSPMVPGDSYRHVHLLDQAGHEIDVPFVNVGAELWDPSGQRITLLLDPGRIKRGLRPREELGPILREGQSYRLMVDADWRDAHGGQLEKPFEKQFRVKAPDEAQPDPRRWHIRQPAAGTRQPLTVEFQEPLDHALLQHALRVTDEAGQTVTGQVEIRQHERRWDLVPGQPWEAGDYRLVVDTTLEDLAGNSVGRPFEVDLFDRVDRQRDRATVAVEFTIVYGQGRNGLAPKSSAAGR